MTGRQPTIASEIDRYLRTGDHDPYHSAWPGSFLERDRRAHRDLREALASEVRRLAGSRSPRSLPDPGSAALTRRKVEPMVRGLFPKVEQEAVLALLERSVIFLTTENLEKILRDYSWHRTSWDLANLYLGSVGAELLGAEAPAIVGLSAETTCYLSTESFAENDPFSDFLVHEAAHVFHNCKRHTAGLHQTRRREWLLDIEFRKRETFAYSCEAYSRIAESAATAAGRRALAEEYGSEPRIAEGCETWEEVTDIVREAAAARNGWKVILRRCAPPPARVAP